MYILYKVVQNLMMTACVQNVYLSILLHHCGCHNKLFKNIYVYVTCFYCCVEFLCCINLDTSLQNIVFHIPLFDHSTNAHAWLAEIPIYRVDKCSCVVIQLGVQYVVHEYHLGHLLFSVLPSKHVYAISFKVYTYAHMSYVCLMKSKWCVNVLTRKTQNNILLQFILIGVLKFW